VQPRISPLQQPALKFATDSSAVPLKCKALLCVRWVIVLFAFTTFQIFKLRVTLYRSFQCPADWWFHDTNFLFKRLKNYTWLPSCVKRQHILLKPCNERSTHGGYFATGFCNRNLVSLSQNYSYESYNKQELFLNEP